MNSDKSVYHSLFRSQDQAARNHIPRVVGLALGALTVGSVLYEVDAAALWWLLLVVNAFVWPHLALLIARSTPRPTRMERYNLWADSALAGFWLVAIDFNLIVGAVIITMPWLNNMAVGGLRLFGQGGLATLATTLVAAAVLGFDWRPEPSMLNIVCTLPMLMIYPQILAFWTHGLARQLNRQRRELEWLSRVDGLSGVHNRQYWEHLARAELSRARRRDEACSLLLLDIDHFKEFNDVHGHLVGDEIIRRVGTILRRELRAEDWVGRYGGEEFAVVLTTASAPAAFAKAEAIGRAIGAESDGLPTVTVSIGVAELDAADGDLTEWLERADRALYRAKALGRDRCVLAPGAADGVAGEANGAACEVSDSGALRP